MEKARIAEAPPSDHAVTLLAVASEQDDLMCLRNICAGAGWSLHEAGTVSQALPHLRQHAIPVVLCEHKLPDGDWTALLDAAFELGEPPYLIVWSRQADNNLWAEVLHIGGYDVLAAPFRVAEVVHAVSAAARRWQEQRGDAAGKAGSGRRFLARSGACS